MKNCSSCSIITGILRIVAWGILLWKWIPKLGASPEMIEAIGSAWPAFLESLGIGMQLFSNEIWFWLAVAGELIAWLLLLFGFKAKLGAWIAILVLLFIWNFKNWDFIGDIPALLITIGAITVLFKGPWAAAFWSQPKKACCCNWKCHDHNDKNNDKKNDKNNEKNNGSDDDGVEVVDA